MKFRHIVGPGFTFSVLSRNPVCLMKLLINLKNNPAPLLQSPQVLGDLGHNHLGAHYLSSGAMMHPPQGAATSQVAEVSGI